MDIQPKMLSAMDPNLLTLITEKECGGNAHSQVVTNGFGKSELRIEETAAEEDSRELRLQLEDNCVVKSMITPKTENGMKSDVPNQSEVEKSNLRLQEKIISQFQELKFTQLNALEVVAMECQEVE
jgi:hypothetical protein